MCLCMQLFVLCPCALPEISDFDDALLTQSVISPFTRPLKNVYFYSENDRNQNAKQEVNKKLCFIDETKKFEGLSVCSMPLQ